MKREDKNYSQAFIRQRNQLIADILILAMTVNDNTEYNVFCNFSGHVDSFNVYILKEGQKMTDMNVVNSYIHLDKVSTEDQAIKELQAIKVNLRGILAKGKIDFSGLNYQEVIGKVYSLH